MAKTSSRVRSMEGDIARIKSGELPKTSPEKNSSNDKNPDGKGGSFPNIGKEDIKKIKTYKKEAGIKKKELEKKLQVVDEELDKINRKLREHEKKEETLSDRAFRKKRRKILKKRRILEEEKIKANKKIKKIKKQIEKLKYFENKLNNSSS